MNTKPTISQPADPIAVTPAAKPPRKRRNLWPLFQGVNTVLVALAAFLFVPDLSFCGPRHVAPPPAPPASHAPVQLPPEPPLEKLVA
jgi:hypothetical protein